MIKGGTYQPSEPRIIKIEKGSGRGYRRIQIQNAEDRCVERTTLQIIRPIIEAQLLDCSMGFRSPGRSREQALARAVHLASTQGLWTWIGEDLRDAFEHVPYGRLSQVLRQLLPNDKICEFIGQIAFNRSGRGIRQGGPLSPTLLNIYLHGMFDRWWVQNYPDAPLIRVADDILILTTPERAAQLYNALHQRMVTIGMPLKGSALTSICHLAQHQSLDWLGYRLRQVDGELMAAIGQKSWDKLGEHLHLAWEEPISSLAANETIRGWIGQQGATFRDNTVSDAYGEILQVARTEGFDEIPDRSEIVWIWSRAHVRDWIGAQLDLQRQTTSSCVPADGSATQHCDSAAISSRHRVGSPTGPSPQVASSRREVSLYCDGSCLSPQRVGAWAFLLVDRRLHRQHYDVAAVDGTTNNRMELLAVIRGLEFLTESWHVHLVIDSQYVYRGLTELLPTWIVRGWRSSGRQGRQIKNVDLWQRLAALLQRHEVDCDWIRGHNGLAENEFVDQLAHRAAEQYASTHPLGAQL